MFQLQWSSAADLADSSRDGNLKLLVMLANEALSEAKSMRCTAAVTGIVFKLEKYITRSFKHGVVGADFEIALTYKITLEQIIQLYEPLVANFTKKLVCLSTLRSLDLVKVQIGPFLSSTQLVRPENAGQEVCGKSICHCTTSSGKKAWKPSASKKR